MTDGGRTGGGITDAGMTVARRTVAGTIAAETIAAETIAVARTAGVMTGAMSRGAVMTVQGVISGSRSRIVAHGRTAKRSLVRDRRIGVHRMSYRSTGGRPDRSSCPRWTRSAAGANDPVRKSMRGGLGHQPPRPAMSIACRVPS